MAVKSKETTRTEEGVLTAEAQVSADVEEMFASSLPERVSDEDTDIEALDTVEDSRTEDGYRTREESSQSHQAEVLEEESGTEEAETEEPQGGEEELEAGEEAEEEAEQAISAEEQLRRTNAAMMVQINKTARDELHGAVPAAPAPVAPAQEMVAQTPPEELPAQGMPSPSQLNPENLLSVTRDDVTEAFRDEDKFLGLLQRVASEAATKGAEVAQLGVSAQVSRQLGTLTVIKDFMALGYNSDIREAPDALMQESVRIESRNPDMKPNEVLEAAADSLREKYSMALPNKSRVGENITQELRSKGKAVTPGQPRHAKATRRRAAGTNGKQKPNDGMTDAEREISAQIAELTRVGGGPDGRPLIR
jgi:hypothetical protein